MKENKRLKKLIKDHFNGEPWIDVGLMQTLKGLSPTDAATNINGLNSVWEIIHHITCWRITLLKRIKGEKIPSPADNYFIPVADKTPKAWRETIARLKSSQKDLLLFLNKDIAGPDEIPAQGAYTRYELLQGVLQHDAYHLGQILLIKKMMAALKAGKYLS